MLFETGSERFEPTGIGAKHLKFELETQNTKDRTMIFLIINGEFRSRTPIYNGKSSEDHVGAQVLWSVGKMMELLKTAGAIEGGSGAKFGAESIQ